MTGFDFEGTVLRPEVNGRADASDTAFIDLKIVNNSDCVCNGIVRTSSAASVPAMANSRSAYFFQ